MPSLLDTTNLRESDALVIEDLATELRLRERTINLGRIARSVRNAQVISRSAKSYEESEDVYRIHSRDGGRGKHP